MNAARAVVLITGATGGIGAAVTRAVHAAGWPVSLFDLSSDPLRGLAEELQADRPGSAILHCGDASSPTDVQAWIGDSIATFTEVHGLVNVAGLFRSAPFSDLSFDDIDETISANLRTTLVCCKLIGKPMLAQGRGSIVNFASTAGEYGSISPAAHYAAAKGGVIALTKSLAREMSPHGVRVNAVSPGPVNTSGLYDGSSANQTDVASRTLLGRLGTPEEIANCVVFLLSDKSSFITGHILGVNGGSLL